MKESEAWDLLGAAIEEAGDIRRDYYLCHIFADLLMGFGLSRCPAGFRGLPVHIVQAMRDRFIRHRSFDNTLVPYKDNPVSWYGTSVDPTFGNMNPYRILFCYAMAWEAWDEENP